MFGRDDEVAALLDLIRTGQTRFLTLIGASGSGKSSLLMGGVCPMLRHGVLGDMSAWSIAYLRPGARPCEALAHAIVGLDASAGMLARAARRLPKGKVTLVHGDATDPAAAGVEGPFDGVMMAYGIRNVPDRDACLRNILALRGDPPRGETTFTPAPGGLRHASELVALIRERGDFCVGAACYPEVHPEAPNLDVDLAHLKTKVDAGVDYLITQLFFDNAVYHRFTAQARAIGVDVPIIPGIMPVTNLGQIERFSRMCGATIPSRLHDRLSQVADDPQEIFWAGVVYAAHQCRSLLEPSLPLPFARPPRGVAGIHFYTLNKSPATRAIFEILRLARSALV
ncbi:MAG: methylenetetrahydrofolate reductase [Myxococcales bacterium]|nr:methylenetetrahydrofolate reductase [Myxococcales bacterium]